jgi:hypothetical protein
VDYRGDGVVGFDLAGAERGHPAVDHAKAFEHALAHGLACTCHAGGPRPRRGSASPRYPAGSLSHVQCPYAERGTSVGASHASVSGPGVRGDTQYR